MDELLVFLYDLAFVRRTCICCRRIVEETRHDPQAHNRLSCSFARFLRLNLSLIRSKFMGDATIFSGGFFCGFDVAQLLVGTQAQVSVIVRARAHRRHALTLMTWRFHCTQ